MKISIQLILAVVVLAVGTFVEGKLSDRWGAAQSDKLETFATQLAKVPMQIGDWVGRDDYEYLSDEALAQCEPEERERRLAEKARRADEFKRSNCRAQISRMYTNREGQQVNVYLVCGTARHTTIHTPDWCYKGAGYESVSDRQQFSIDLDPENPGTVVAETLQAGFRKETPTEKSELRIFWAFSDDGNWQGPRIPKAHFAGRPALYKLYLITDLSNQVNQTVVDADPAVEFAQTFIPTINRILFQGIGTEAVASVE